MGLLVEAFHPRPRAADRWAPPPQTDGFWYTSDPAGYIAETVGTGIALSAETILRCSTVLAAVRFRGDSWAMCPPSTYQKTATGRLEMPEHYSQRVLRRPNLWQTGNRWRHVNGVWMALWGNAYNEIVAGPRSFADELRPIHPATIRVVDQRADGSLLYQHTAPGQPPRTLGQERVLHFRDLSTDGLEGVAMYRMIRNVVGIALLAEQHASTFLRKGARISGLLVPSAPLGKPERDVLRESVNQEFGGYSNTGTIGVLPHGVDLKELSLSNRDAQFLEISDQVIGMILRFLGVPGVVVGWADKTATYASAEAFFEKGGIKHCVLPILINVEAEEEKALLPDGESLQIKHNLDVLQRANTKDRYESLFRAVGGPWMTRNEARRIEDLNEDSDPEMDRVLTPSNMAPELQREAAGGSANPNEDRAEGGSGGGPLPPRNPESPPDEDEEVARRPAALRARTREQILAELYAHDNAERIVKREIAAVRAKAPKLARDRVGWRAFVLETYGKHAPHVAEVMRISEDEARAYCDGQAAQLLAHGVAALEAWETEIPPRLAALALKGEA